MRIGELARRTGVEAGTLRAWERRFGLLDPVRTKGGQRQYSEVDVDRVLTVRRLLAEGLTLSSAVERVLGGEGAFPPGEAETLLLRQIIQNIPAGVIVGKDGRTLYTNRRMAEMLRCTVDELLTTSLLTFTDPDDLRRSKGRMADLRRGIDAVYERRVRRADGTSFDADIHIRPLFDRAGRYEGSVAVVNDVTERKAAEAEHRFRAALLDAVGEAVTASNNDGVITYVNSAAVALTGWPAEEFVGRHIDSFPTASPETREDLAKIRERVLAGDRFSGEIPLVRRDGSTSTCQLTSTPFYDADGKPVGRINLMQDISERMHINQELRTRDLRASVIAVFGARAVAERTGTSSGGESLLHEIVGATRRLLGADRVTITEVDGDGKLVVRATSADGGPAAFPSGGDSLAGYAMLARSVVVVEDVASERRFDTASFDADTRSAIAAPVFAPGGCNGALIAERTEVNSFDGTADFLQSIANIVGAALK